jgi:hypothetical protein
MVFTDLNIEQSLAKYLADLFSAAGYKIYWWDTKQTVGSQSVQVTFVREFPEDPAYLVNSDQTNLTDSHIKVPALTIRSVSTPSADDGTRLGIGESIFDWEAEVRVEGFADNEKQWYEFTKLFQTWLMNPDVRVPVADYQADLTNTTPTINSQYMRFFDKDLRRTELDASFPVAARYFIGFAATARFIE